MINTDVLILGGGPGGIQGSRTLKMENPDLDVAMIRQERASMIYCAIPYALEGLFGKDRVLKKDELVTGVGVRLFKETAVSVDLKAHRVVTREGNTFAYDKILIVTGSKAFVPPVEGHTLEGILTLKTENDMLRILKRLEGGARKTVVIGAGAVGLEQALAYRHRGLEVHLVDMAPRILPNLTDADMTRNAHEVFEEKGIIMHMGTPLKAFHGSKHVEGVEIGTGEVIPLEPGKDFVLVSVGMKPDIELVASQLEVERDGIVVTPRMETSVPGVYAAGDCVQGWSGIDGKPLGGKLATNAVPMAKVAAMNILGRAWEYPGFFNGAITIVGDIRLGGTGFTEDFARTRGFEPVTAYGETLSRFPMMPDAKTVRVKLIADKETGRIIGGQVNGFEAVAERVDIITLSIQRKLTAAELAQLSYSAQPWQTFFPARNAIVEAATKLAKKLSSPGNG